MSENILSIFSFIKTTIKCIRQSCKYQARKFNEYHRTQRSLERVSQSFKLNYTFTYSAVNQIYFSTVPLFLVAKPNVQLKLQAQS